MIEYPKYAGKVALCRGALGKTITLETEAPGAVDVSGELIRKGYCVKCAHGVALLLLFSI